VNDVELLRGGWRLDLDRERGSRRGLAVLGFELEDVDARFAEGRGRRQRGGVGERDAARARSLRPMNGRRLRVEGDYRGVGLCYAEGTAKRGDLP